MEQTLHQHVTTTIPHLIVVVLPILGGAALVLFFVMMKLVSEKKCNSTERSGQDDAACATDKRCSSGIGSTLVWVVAIVVGFLVFNEGNLPVNLGSLALLGAAGLVVAMLTRHASPLVAALLIGGVSMCFLYYRSERSDAFLQAQAEVAQAMQEVQQEAVELAADLRQDAAEVHRDIADELEGMAKPVIDLDRERRDPDEEGRDDDEGDDDEGDDEGDDDEAEDDDRGDKEEDVKQPVANTPDQPQAPATPEPPKPADVATGPLADPALATRLPDWVADPPVGYEVISSEPHTTRLVSKAEVDGRVADWARGKIAERTGVPIEKVLGGIDVASLVDRSHNEPRQTSFGEMHVTHYLIKSEPRFEQSLIDRMAGRSESLRRQNNAGKMAAGGAALLGALAAAYGLLSMGGRGEAA